MKIHPTILFALAILAGCASNSVKGPNAVAQLQPVSGGQVSGTVFFTQLDDKSVQITANITGLIPGEHGFHIHEVGNCSAADFSSAGGHFNPNHMHHGGPDSSDHHAGDLGNLDADANGDATLQIKANGISVSWNQPDGIIGRSIIVHSDVDDYFTQPSGNSGKRIACGVIHLVP